MSTTTTYQLAVHLATEQRPSRPLAKAMRLNGLKHPDRGTAMIAARNIMAVSPAEVEGVNVSRVRAEHLCWVRP